MQILDHEHQRPVGGQPLNHPEHQLQQPGVPLFRQGRQAQAPLGSQLGQQPRQLLPRVTNQPLELLGLRHPHQRAQRIDQRAER